MMLTKPRKANRVKRRLVRLLDGSSTIKLPLILLDCGHQVRTEAIRWALCRECADQYRHRSKGDDSGKDAKVAKIGVSKRILNAQDKKISSDIT